ncbi:MAG TPA: phosphatidylinositol-specific phospholipase C1-like protein [Actinophytocola sp.]|uniref:phosphatidylinositol-specific phospholipase C1-like protein n=1 Tax=Actinophytocola sp. TaxID=1872138 RepID=UPI002DDD5483|nr:phosphatidylinositol-specific phospholipase C1-like protein [Actinophytocola sp.]HEV2782251.1 phosphatidylinositol-specific phospholipase C1-like protein [Actinophytocola sp.]
MLRTPRRRRMATAALVLGMLFTIPAVASARSNDIGVASSHDGVRLNQIQVVGSHNSYHVEATPAEKAIRIQLSPATETELEFTAAPINEQLGAQHVRQVEFDVFADPDGGLYATPMLRELAGEGPYDPAMRQPGTKVLHAQDADYHTRCLTLVACLRQVKDWSDRNRGHLAIAIMLEFNDAPLTVPGDPTPVPGTVIPLPWTRDRMLALEREILSVFSRDRLITPDSVRRPGMTLEQSVLASGWPTVEQTRGKVMFLMDQKGFVTTYRDAYVQGNPSLEGRLMFTQSQPGQPDGAFMKRYVWDAGGPEQITDLVRRGYMVRTRADHDTLEARANDPAHRDTALASGAQWVSTDYPAPGMADRFGSPYFVAIPGGTVARCNPIVLVSGCDSAALEPARR